MNEIRKPLTKDRIEEILFSVEEKISYGGDTGLFSSRFWVAAEAIHDALPSQNGLDYYESENARLTAEWRDLLNQRGVLEDFLKGEVLEALTDLLNYIDNAGWTRHQQAEHDACVETMTKLSKLCGLI